MEKGKFIVIEGMGGSGKTTCINFLKEKLADKSFVFTREPGGTQIGDRIRDVLVAKDLLGMATETEILLFGASRVQHLQELIIPRLEQGINVFSDRFDPSTYAYQICGNQNGDLKESFYLIDEFVVGKNRPDLYIFLDLTPEESIRRIGDRARTDNRFDDKERDYWTRVREGYLEFLKDRPNKIIDASKTKEEVAEEVYQAVSEIL